MAALPLLTFGALVAAAWPWTARYDRRPTVRLLASLVLASLAVVLLQVALGVANALGPATLLVLAWGAAAVAALGGIAASRGTARSLSRPPAASAIGSRLGLAPPTVTGAALGALALAAYGWLLFVATLVPPFGWDALAYHLTDVFHAAASRSLAPFSYPAGNLYFPQVGELHSLWAFLLGGAGGQAWRLTPLGLLPLALTGGVAARAAAEALSCRAGLPWIVPGFVLAPVVMIQPLAGYVDVALAAFVLAAFAFAILAASEARFAHLAFCAVASGLALGVKLSFLYYGLPVLVLLLFPGAWRWMRGLAWPRRVGALAVAAVLFAAGPGYWLGRNLLRTGNPIYPTPVAVAGFTILDGPREIFPSDRQQGWFVPGPASWARYPILETFNGEPAYTLENGFGPLFPAGLVASAAVLVSAIRKRRGVLLGVLAAVPLTLVAWLLVSPYREPRYVIACAGFALVALAAAAEGLARRGPLRLANAAVAAAIVFGALGGAASAAPDLGEVLSQRARGAWTPERYYVLHYGTAGEAFNWIASESGPGKNVTFTNGNFVAPLFGWHGRNRVVYGATRDDPPVGGARRHRTYAAWRKFLLDERVDWVVVWVPWWGEQGSPTAEGWIASHPPGFELLREFGAPEQVRARVYRPLFSDSERADLALLDPAGGLDALDEPETWVVEYRTGTEIRTEPDPAGGARIAYAFGSESNDYADLRADLEEEVPEGVRALAFRLDSPIADTLLFVYLKEKNPEEACRFRVDLRGLPAGPRAVRLDFGEPEWATPGFDPSRIGSVHLVLDDAEDRMTGTGSLAVSRFRMER